MQDNLIWLGEWQVNSAQNTLSSCGDIKKLEHKPMQVLLQLIADAGNLVTKEQLVEQVWHGRVVSDDAIAVAVSQIRKALSDNARSPRFIKTIPGRGYCLIAEVRQEKISEQKLEPALSSVGEQQLRTEKKKLIREQGNNKRSSGLLLLLTLVVVAFFVYLYSPDDKNAEQVNQAQNLQANDPYEATGEARQLLNSSELKNWQKALAMLESAMPEGEKRAEFYLLIARAKFKILNIQYNEVDERLPEYRQLLLRALALNDNDAEVHLALANLYFLADWQFQKANSHFLQALELAPEKIENHFNYLNFLLALNRLEDAKKHTQIIRKIDPYTYSLPMMAWVNNMQRHYDLATQETEKLLSLNPNSFDYHWSAQSIAENRGHHEGALKHMLKLLDTFDYSAEEREQLALIAEQSGLPGIYHWLLHTKQETRNIGQYLPPLSFARYALASGDKALALDYLEQALAIRQTEILWLKVDPKYDGLREEPRFQAIIAQIGIDVI